MKTCKKCGAVERELEDTERVYRWRKEGPPPGDGWIGPIFPTPNYRFTSDQCAADISFANLSARTHRRAIEAAAVSGSDENMTRKWEPDFSDYGRMLESIGGWTIGCMNHVENAAAVDKAKAEGLLGERIHRCPIDPKGWPCFELTDAGIAKVLELRGNKVAERVARIRQWYRDNAAKNEAAQR